MGVEKRFEYNGYKLRSKSELKIAIILDKYHIRWRYEKPQLILVKDCKEKKFHPDFNLIDFDSYLEYFGTQENEIEDKYWKRVRDKEKCYQINGICNISIYNNEMWWPYGSGGLKKNFEQFMMDKICKYARKIPSIKLLDYLERSGALATFKNQLKFRIR
jgi:hypothetical protein